MDPQHVKMLRMSSGKTIGWQAPPPVVIKQLRAVFVDPESEEWDYAWDQAVPGEDKLEEHIYGEVWQYMGTWKNEDGTWLHHFRHRMHPRTNQRVLRQVRVSQGFNPYDYSKNL